MSSNVTICAPFRNSQPTLSRFIDSVTALDYAPDHLRVIAVEGDSSDETPHLLAQWADGHGNVTLLTCDTGRPQYGSIVNAERFEILAQVFNTALDAVDLLWSDYVLFTPSDVAFGAGILAQLLAHDKDIVAPMFWLGDIFYDTWGMAHNGRNFLNFTRAWGADHFGGNLIEMDTVGGMILMRADVIRAGCRYTPEEVDRGLCKMAQAQGYRCWLDTAAHIEHIGRRITA